ncbi:MAG: hypothetical protein ACO1N0_18255 [Fluviicola sp.]
MELKALLFNYGPWIIIAPVLLSLVLYNRLSKALKIITWYLILSVLTQAVSLWLWKKSINNLPLLHAFTVLEFFLLFAYYSFQSKQLLTRFWTYGIPVLFLGFALLDAFVLENLHSFNIYTRSLEAFIFIGCSVHWFIRSITLESKVILQDQNGLKYMNAGFFIYFSCSLILFAFSNYINHLGRPLLMNIWTLHSLLLIVLYLFILIGFCKINRK